MTQTDIIRNENVCIITGLMTERKVEQIYDFRGGLDPWIKAMHDNGGNRDKFRSRLTKTSVEAELWL